MVRCHKCGQEMIRTDNTPVGLKIPDKHDNLYFVHPSIISCNVVDYVIKVGYRA